MPADIRNYPVLPRRLLATCGHRVALAFAYIEDAIVDHTAAKGGMSEDALLALGKQKFRQSVVDNLAREKTASLTVVDPVEVELAYRVKLQGTIDLPGKTSDMLFFGVAGVNDQDLDHARGVVQSLESSTQMQDFLCEYQPWRSHLKRAHADVFEVKLQSVNAEKDRLSIKPSEMTEGEYMQQCASLNTQERQMEDEAVRELTLLQFADA